jgi:hypothetical protein
VALIAPAKPRVTVRPITPADRPAVAEFMHTHLNARVPAAAWAGALDVPWSAEQPNGGFMLLADDAVVGANLAFYSEREIAGRTERICNLGAWCVLEEHRFHGLRLLKSLLGQDGYHFTDLSPSGNVVGLNEKLGFAFLDTTTAVLPNLPVPAWPGRGRVSSDPAVIERTLDARELAIYRDHARAAAARHAVLTRGGEHCYVIFRKDRRKGLPLFASILYVSHPELFRRMARQLGRHLLLRHGAVATLVERAVVDHRPRLSLTVDSPRRKMFKSPTLASTEVDYLYSELVCLSW